MPQPTPPQLATAVGAPFEFTVDTLTPVIDQLEEAMIEAESAAA